MKNKLLAILALIVFSLAVLMPEVLISMNNFVLGKVFFVMLILLYTNLNVVAGITMAILFIYLNNLSQEGMENIEPEQIEKIAKLTDKKIHKIVNYNVSGSNTPSTLDKADLSKQLRPIDSKTLPSFNIKDDLDEPEPTNPALENFKVIAP